MLLFNYPLFRKHTFNAFLYCKTFAVFSLFPPFFEINFYFKYQPYDSILVQPVPRHPGKLLNSYTHYLTWLWSKTWS